MIYKIAKAQLNTHILAIFLSFTNSAYCRVLYKTLDTFVFVTATLSCDHISKDKGIGIPFKSFVCVIFLLVL